VLVVLDGAPSARGRGPGIPDASLCKSGGMFPMVAPGGIHPGLPSAGLECTGRLVGVARGGDPSGAPFAGVVG